MSNSFFSSGMLLPATATLRPARSRVMLPALIVLFTAPLPRRIIEQLTLCLKVLPDDETSLRDRTVAYKQRATMYYKLGRYDLGDKDYEKYKELKKETGFDY